MIPFCFAGDGIWKRNLCRLEKIFGNGQNSLDNLLTTRPAKSRVEIFFIDVCLKNLHYFQKINYTMRKVGSTPLEFVTRFRPLMEASLGK